MPHLTIKGATEEKLTFYRVLKKSFHFQAHVFFIDIKGILNNRLYL
jgi:hypothetical protein